MPQPPWPQPDPRGGSSGLDFPPRLPPAPPRFPPGPPQFPPPPPWYGGPPPGGGFPPPPRPKPFYTRPWFIVLAVVVGLIVLGDLVDAAERPRSGVTAAGVASTGPDAGEPQAPEEEEALRPGIGEPVVDGDLQFVVNSVDCGTTTIGSPDYGAAAQGQFCIVDLAITNVGDEVESFYGDNAVLLNAEEQRFSADGGAALYLDDGAFLWEEVNPGNTLDTAVVFDVPPGMAPSAIELHSTMFSRGVIVVLR